MGLREIITAIGKRDNYTNQRHDLTTAKIILEVSPERQASLRNIIITQHTTGKTSI